MTSSANGTILVGGATGQQGGAVARHLLDRGFEVRALTRNPTQKAARALVADGAQIVEGDFEDRTSLDRALRSADGAFSVQNTWTGGETDIAEQVLEGTADYLLALKANHKTTYTEKASTYWIPQD